MYVPTEYLSPADFEKFANEIVSRKFQIPIISFGEGPDGGIDGIDDSINPKVVVQSKRYQPTTSPKEFAKIVMREIEKLEKTVSDSEFPADFDYVIVTSVKLNPETRRDIRNIKSNWIKSENNIIDANDLAILSDDPDYEDIFRKYNLVNGKLIDAVGQINLNKIALENFAIDPSFEYKYIVETSVMREAYSCLRENRMVFLVGHPGVGKSISSQYLGILSAEWKDIPAKVICRSLADTQEVIETFNSSFSGKQSSLVVIFDDFLGRNTLEAREKDYLYIRRLADIVKNTNNFFVIFNSRIEILKQGTNDHVEFGKFIHQNSVKKLTFDINKSSDIEKAWILRKNFEKIFNDTAEKKQNIINNYNELVEKKYYKNIVSHKNYNPRIIEFIVREARDNKKNFLLDVENILNNPKKIYDEIFRKLSENEKMYLYSFASFGEYPINEENIMKLFNQLIPHMGTIDDIYGVLDGAWIRRLYIDDVLKIDFINPSLYDYLISRLRNDRFSVQKIIQHSPFLRNIQNISFNDFITEIAQSNWKSKYTDYRNFIGNKLLSIIKSNSSQIDEFKSLLYEYKDDFQIWGNHRFIKNNWNIILECLINCETNLDSIFMEELLFSKDNQLLFNLLVNNLQLNELIKLINNIDLLLEKVYFERLNQNELIDFSEESTNFNVFSNFVSLLENKIIESLEFEIRSLIEEYFDKNNIDVSSLCHDEYTFEDFLTIDKTIVNEYMISLTSEINEIFYNAIDSDYIIDGINDIFRYELEEYFSDHDSILIDNPYYTNWMESLNKHNKTMLEIFEQPL